MFFLMVSRYLVFLQVLVSPLLAGLAVGVGVPILLFYVYGVVPVSLCRSGGCGVSTNGSGVRFEFDDENELMGALGGRNVGGNYFNGSDKLFQLNSNLDIDFFFVDLVFKSKSKKQQRL